MSISDCKGCKVSSAGHNVGILGLRRTEYISTASYTSTAVNYFNDTSYKEEKVYKWKCNKCGYESLRFSGEDNTEQFHPVEPIGKDLDDRIPETIRNDFNEARKIAKPSPRCGNVLLRTCLEGLCNWIAEELLEDDKKTDYPKKELNRKIEYIKKHTHFVSDRLFKTMNIIKEYGNEIHAHKNIDDSDTLESFEVMRQFIESICDKILLELQEIETVNEYHQKIPQKTKI